MTTAVASDTFVVRPDRAAARHMLRLQVGLGAVLVSLGVLTTVWADGPGERSFRVLSTIFWAVMIPYQVALWRRFMAADALAEIGPAGMRVMILGSGRVTLPWSAVASVRGDWAGRIVVRLAEGTGPGTPGTEWPSDRRAARRARRRKLFVPSRQADAAGNQILAAITHFSGGRL